MRRLLTLGYFVFLALLAGAQEGGQILFLKKPDPSVPTPALMLKKSVVEIELQCTSGNSNVSGGGTGFLAAYADPRLPSGTFFDYLVTNRHVAECWDEHNHPRNIQSQAIRINAKDGSSRPVALPLGAWHFPVDDSVDLAVLPVTLPDGLEFVVIPVTEFATKDYLSSHRITEGSPIMLSGYFYQFSGEKKFQSIVRQGILSMIPDEPMMTTTGKPGTLYLGDIHIFGGNSGAPVMVGDTLNINGYHLLGVISGYYYEDADFNLEIATTVHGTMHANSGVAMIVPIDFLKDMLDGPELKGIRENYFSHAASPSGSIRR